MQLQAGLPAVAPIAVREQDRSDAPAPEETPDITGLKAALQAQLKALIEAPLTPRMLTRIASAATLARDLLIAVKDPRAMNRRLGGNIALGYGSLQGGATYDDDFGDMSPNPYPGGMRAETFGATMVREGIAALKEMKTPKPTASELVNAIAVAKEKGLDAHVPKLEAALEEALGIVKPPVAEPQALPSLVQVHECHSEDVQG